MFEEDSLEEMLLELEGTKPKPKKPKRAKKAKKAEGRAAPTPPAAGAPVTAAQPPASGPVPLPDEPAARAAEIRARLGKIKHLKGGGSTLYEDEAVGASDPVGRELIATEDELRAELTRLEAEGLPAQATTGTFTADEPVTPEPELGVRDQIVRHQRQLEMIDTAIEKADLPQQRARFKSQRYKLRMKIFNLASEGLKDAGKEVKTAEGEVRDAQAEVDRLTTITGQPMAGLKGREPTQAILELEQAESRLELSQGNLTEKNADAETFRALAIEVDAPVPELKPVARPGAGRMYPERYGDRDIPTHRALEKVIEAETGIRSLPIPMAAGGNRPLTALPRETPSGYEQVESPAGYGTYGRGPGPVETNWLELSKYFNIPIPAGATRAPYLPGGVGGARVPVLGRGRGITEIVETVPAFGTGLDIELERYAKPGFAKALHGKEPMGGHFAGGIGFAPYAPPGRSVEDLRSSVTKTLRNRMSILSALNEKAVEAKAALDEVKSFDPWLGRSPARGRNIPKRQKELALAARLGDLIEQQEYVASEVEQLKRVAEYSLAREPRQVEEGHRVLGPRGKWLMPPERARIAEQEYEEEQLEHMRLLGMIEPE